ncbi:MAG: DUF222 domain-containing protein [Acidimicrobiales bacterium]
MTTASNMNALNRLATAVAEVQEVSFDTMAPAEQLRYVRLLEVARRRVEHGADRATGLLDASAAFSVDGHRNVRNAVKHLGRLSGSEALVRTQTIRALQLLPVVEAAYAAGRIPIAHIRLIARIAANPRVHEHLEAADPLFANRASVDAYDRFQSWMQQWQLLADPDGAERDDEINHAKRRVHLHDNFDTSWSLDGQFGALQGATLAEVVDHYEQAEFEADWAWARQRYGDNARGADLPRTSEQRRADALVAMATAAASAPADGRRPEPSVHIVIDQKTFEAELRRACGEETDSDPNIDVDGRVCHTINGTPLHPTDALAAAMVGFVRRVVVDSSGTVIDLGRRRRLFTGSSRGAALLQAFLREPGGLRCFWPGCDVA